MKHLRRIIHPRDPAQKVHILPPIRVDSILSWIRMVYVKKGFELPDRLGVLVDAADELLGYAFNYRFVHVVPVLRREIGP